MLKDRQTAAHLAWKSVYIISLLVLGLLSALHVADGYAGERNTVAAFFSHAERQSETDGQRREISRALNDMLLRPPAELANIRYEDYQGNTGRWTLLELLRHYFATKPRYALNPARFYTELSAPEARAAIKRQLMKVDLALGDTKPK